MAEKRHHRYGPSTLDSLSRCVRFKYNDSDEDAADEGTMLHAAFESRDLTGLDEEQRRCVSTILSYVEALKFEHGMTPADWKDLAEFDVELQGLTYGCADRILFCSKLGILHVIDAKFTRVDKSHEQQLCTYGAAFTEHANSAVPGAVKRVFTHVVAPRLGPLEPHEYDADTLVKEVREYIEALYERIEDPFTQPTPHEDLCGKCGRAARCPALGKVVTTVTRGLGLPLPEVFAPDALVSLRDRAIAQVLAGVVINWGEQIKKNNAAFVGGGGEIPGYRMMTRSTGLRVPKEATREAIEAVRKVIGLGEEETLKCCNLVIGDLIALVASDRGLSDAEAKELVRDTLEDIVSEGTCSFLTKEKRIADGALLTQVIGG